MDNLSAYGVYVITPSPSVTPTIMSPLLGPVNVITVSGWVRDPLRNKPLSPYQLYGR